MRFVNMRITKGNKTWKTIANCEHCYALMMITGVIETFAICHLYRLLWP